MVIQKKSIAKGQSIGHKRIHKIDSIEVEQLRVENKEKNIHLL